MQGKTKCPYCGKNVVVEVPDGAKGIQRTKCPNCGMNIKVDVSAEEKYSWEKESPIHPSVKPVTSSKPIIAGALLIIVFILGMATGLSILLAGEDVFEGNGIYEAKVVDNEGNALQGVEIYLVNQTFPIAETDENGFFKVNLSAGRHVIELRKEGYNTIRVEVFVLPSNLPFKASMRDEFTMLEGNKIKEEKTLMAMAMDMVPVFAYAIILISFLPLIGAIFCFMKKHFVVAIIGAIFGIFTLGFIIGALLSIVALILLIISRDEFGKEAKY